MIFAAVLLLVFCVSFAFAGVYVENHLAWRRYMTGWNKIDGMWHYFRKKKKDLK